MKQYIGLLALVVRDYDEAIEFYTKKMHFTLVEDTPQSETKRWVVVAPPGSGNRDSGTGGAGTCNLLLAKGVNEEQRSRIGYQTGGRVFLFLYTDDFWRDYKDMQERGIEFVREPIVESYGTVSVFRDLYGNLWDLVEPT